MNQIHQYEIYTLHQIGLPALRSAYYKHLPIIINRVDGELCVRKIM
jgi:hypothetical protein